MRRGRAIADDARWAGRSLVAVATSPVMPRWEEYRERVERSRAAVAPVDDVDALWTAICRGRLSPCARALQVTGALVSFVDDHREPVPEALFPRGPTLHFLSVLAIAPRAWGRAEQLAAAYAITGDGHRALWVCHAATRQLARGRDGRALGAEAPATVEARCRVGRAIAAFPAALSEGGDPLGDTYHYWANVIAGVTAALLGGARGRAMAALFGAGPWLMRTVRERAFGRRLFYGDHARIDALGLAHGRALGARSASRT